MNYKFAIINYYLFNYNLMNNIKMECFNYWCLEYNFFIITIVMINFSVVSECAHYAQDQFIFYLNFKVYPLQSNLL